MASVDLTKGDGTIKAGTNTVAGVAYPVVNVGFSTAGSAPTQVDASTGLPISATTLPLPTGAATAAKQPALGTAGTASADVISIQGIASMTPVAVSGTVSVTANSAVNVAQVAGTATDVNSGNKSAGTIRVVLATDQPALTNALKVDGSAVTQPVSGAISFTAPQHVIVDSGTLTTVSTVSTITNVVHVDDNSGSLTVDNAGTFAVQSTIAAGATNIAKAEDAASANADVGVPAMAIQLATPADLAGTDADYAMLQMSGGRLWTSANIDKINGVTPLMGNGASGTGALRVTVASDSTGLIAVKGGTASDAALANAPVTIGGRATNTNLAEMSADGDVVDATFTMQGALIIAEAPRELVAPQQTQISNSTSETTVVTAGASGIFNDISSITLANTGSSGTKVTLKDATAGTTRWIGYVPATDMRGIAFPIPLPQASAANNWTVTCGTATTALEVTITYIKRK